MEQPPSNKGQPSITPSTVLVVDDEPDTRAVINFSLRPDGHRILEAGNGREALEVCRKQLPDAVITDIMMPQVDGIEFVKLFRTEFPGRYIPFLMLTAKTEVEQKIRGFEAGADDYLTKPFHHRELRARLNALLRTKVLTDALELRSKELEASNAKLSQLQAELVNKERQVVAMQLAGAAAHRLGQPVTAILLNCRLLEQVLKPEDLQQQIKDSPIHQAASAISAIKRECGTVQEVLEKLQSADPQHTEEYVGELRILDLD